MALESLILDARGNPFQGQLDAIGGEVFTDARVAGALLGALNAELLMDINGKAVAMFDIRTAAGALTLVAEGTIDGTNYFSLPMFANQQLLGAAIVQESFVPSIVIATTQSGFYTVGVSGIRRVRIRVSAYTSGNVTVTGRASIADQIIQNRPLPTNLWVTATAAANTGFTLTLPAAGAGMFHYITSMRIVRNATAALAGTATLIYTTTNLPGSPAWSVGNNMIAGGTQLDLDEQFAFPLKSSVANTNTTIVAPACGAAVLARISVGYFVGF